jgi:membrane associated rhomboid family serine protease
MVRMALFLAAVVAACVLLFAPLRDAFLTNPALNGMILAVLLLGIAYNFRQVLRLRPEVDWIDHFRSEQGAGYIAPPPRLLAPMATMIGERRGRLTLSAPAMRTLLDGIASRLDESRDLSRYTIGLLVFLGLLGTFWGLLQTVGSIGQVISGLTIEGGDMAAVFADLKRGLQAPIAGMGTAFSSSLFGLGGSLILGFLDLQAAQAQNRFYNELEEWLSGLTRLSGGALAGGDLEHPVSAYVQALLEQTAESLDSLQQTLVRGEEGRVASHGQFAALSEKIGTLADQMQTEQALMLRLAETQMELKPVLARLSEGIGAMRGGGFDDATRSHIRNLELLASRIVDEMVGGREEVIRQVRGDIKLLARTIAAKSESGEHK